MPKDFEGLVNSYEPKINSMEDAPHDLSVLLESWREKSKEIRQNRDLSAEGKQKQISELKATFDAELNNLNETMEMGAQILDEQLEMLEKETDEDDVEIPEPPEDLRFPGEKAVWQGQRAVEVKLDKMINLFSETQQYNLLLAELPTKAPSEIVKMLDAAIDNADWSQCKNLIRLGKPQIIEGKNERALTRFNNLIKKYEDFTVPKHVPKAKALRGKLAEIRGRWQNRYRMILPEIR